MTGAALEERLARELAEEIAAGALAVYRASPGRADLSLRPGDSEGNALRVTTLTVAQVLKRRMDAARKGSAHGPDQP